MHVVHLIQWANTATQNNYGNLHMKMAKTIKILVYTFKKIFHNTQT